MTEKTKATKAAPKAGAEKKAEKAAKVAAKRITVTQVASPIGRQSYQRDTLIGLGLNKIRRSRVLEDSAAVRGMIARVKHLVQVSEA